MTTSTQTSVRPAPARAKTPPRRPERRRPRRIDPAVLMTLPAVLGVLVFTWLPFGIAAGQSLTSFNPVSMKARGFAGLDNYLQMVHDPTFRTALVNTVLFVVFILVVEIPLALGLAILLDSRLPATFLARAAVLAALAAPEVATVLNWSTLFQRDNGLLNAVLGSMSVGPLDLLTDGTQAKAILVVVAVWKDVGLATLILLAGLQAIPKELYEASSLDGAGRIAQFRHITVPALRRSLGVAVFMVTVAATRLFTPILLLTQGGPGDGTTNLMFYAYQQAFSLNSFGVASAATVVMVLLLMIISLAQARLFRGGDR
jgi:ABC-type sugar transport system permease subunit